jgi:hypothetical protein
LVVEEGDIDRTTRLQRDWVFVECLDFNAAEPEIPVDLMAART